MPKTKISEFSATPANNTDIDSINIAEGCAPSGINDAIRELMAQLKDFQTGAAGDSFNGPVGTTTAAAGAFTTLSASGAVTLSGGTANGVAYLNGSKVVTSGSALTFDGTNFAVGTSSPVANTPLTLQALSGYTDILWLKSVGTNIDSRINIAPTGTGVAQLNNTNGTPIAFQISGSEQMRLTSTGLGIGTSSPAAYAKLTVAGTAGAQTGASQQIVVNAPTTTAGQGAGIRLTAASGAKEAVAILGVVNQASGNAGAMTFHVYNGGADVPEYMRLDSSGNLGLGVTPSAWGSPFSSVMQFTKGSIACQSNSVILFNNAYYDGSNYRYVNTAGAGYYEQTGGQHIWNRAASGTAGNAITFTQAMTLDASGNLGLGTTSLNLSGGASGSQVMTISASSSGRNGILELNGTRTTSGDYVGYVRFFNNGAATPLADIQAIRGSSDTTGVLAFATGNTERARIDSSGNLLVGTTSVFNGTNCTLQVSNSASNQAFAVRNTNAYPYGIYINYSAATPNSTGEQFIYCNDSTALRMEVRSNGGIANYSGNDSNLSDRREKTNFAPAKSYLDVICSIPVQTFNYIDQNMEDDDGLTLGVVAQDVQAVAPELVMESNWGTEEEPKMRLSIYQTDLQYALMKALQELKAEFDAYKASHP